MPTNVMQPALIGIRKILREIHKTLVISHNSFTFQLSKTRGTPCIYVLGK